MTAPAFLPDAVALGDADKRALDKLGTGRFIRRTGGWVAGSGSRISLDTAKRLIARHLARVDTAGRNPQLVLTGAGKDVRAVILARKRT